MNKEQEAKFREFNDEQEKYDGTLHAAFNCVRRNAWQACLEANGIGEDPRIPDGYFKPGEDIEVQGDSGLWHKASIGIVYGRLEKSAAENANLRRIPEWNPRDDEVVFLKYAIDTDIAVIGRVTGSDGHFFKTIDQNGQTDGYPIERIKPFDSSAIGKTWSEI